MQPQRRRILFLIPTLAGGGAERVMVTLLKHLDRDKFEPSLAVLHTSGVQFFDQLPSDVPLLNLQVSRVRYALPKIIRLIWRMRPQVVFSTLGHLNLALSAVRPLLPRKTKYVARETVVVSELLRADNLSSAWSLAYRHLYARFDSIVCQSLDMRDDIVANFNIPASKTAVINNPLDIENIRRLAAYPVDPGLGFEERPAADRPMHLIAAGRLTKQKGFDLLIEAVALSGLKQLRVTVLGGGPLRGTLEEQAKARGVCDQIRFIGFQKNPYAFMARADAFVLSSRFEGFPNAVLEALACGIPVVATPAPGGLSEIAKSIRSVRLASAVTAEALSAEFRKFVQAPPASGPFDLTQFRADVIARKYEQVFLGGPQPQV